MDIWKILCLLYFGGTTSFGRVPYRSEEGYPTGIMSIYFQPTKFKKKWLQNMNVSKNWTSKKSHEICSKHFDPNCFIGSRKLLKFGSVPTIFEENVQGPGSTKPAEIPRSQLKYLFFVVQGDGQRQKYTYWTANQIANDPKIDFRRKTVLIVLGYLDSSGFPIAAMFANEYEAQGYNVIVLDNQRFATVHYYLATRLMRPVGRRVAEVLAQLTQHGLDPAQLELLGFSLGGQTASFIGSHFQLLTGRNVSRITALEPSGPCFRTLGPKERLDASNADFVDVIHTNIDGFGMATRMGHVDFYVNGGEYQPSDISMFPCTVTCSHFRVLSLWVQALKHPRKFVALKCDNIQQARASDCYKRTPLEVNYLGLNVDKAKQGIFYLSTDKSFPFYLGEDGLKPEFVYWKRISNVNDGNKTEIYT